MPRWLGNQRHAYLRVYREAGLLVRKRKRKRIAGVGRQVKVPASRPNESLSIDFVSNGLVDGRRLRCLNIVDDFTNQCLAIEVDTSLPGRRVVAVLERLAESRGLPKPITIDNVLNARGFAEKGKSIPAKRKLPFGSAKRASTTIQCSSTSRVSLPDHSGHKIRSVQRHDLHRT